MQMSVEHIRAKIARHLPSLEKEQYIQIKLVPRRSGRQLFIPWDFNDSLGRDSRHVTTDMVGDNPYVVANGSQGTGFFVNTYVTAPISKVGGWGDHEDFESIFHCKHKTLNRTLIKSN